MPKKVFNRLLGGIVETGSSAAEEKPVFRCQLFGHL
jgi:hypothetical protein